MPRANSGSIHVRTLVDGSRVFRLRFNAYDKRRLVNLHEREGCSLRVWGWVG